MSHVNTDVVKSHVVNNIKQFPLVSDKEQTYVISETNSPMLSLM